MNESHLKAMHSKLNVEEKISSLYIDINIFIAVEIVSEITCVLKVHNIFIQTIPKIYRKHINRN